MTTYLTSTFDLMESVDSKPLVTRAQELFPPLPWGLASSHDHHFPYDRLPLNGPRFLKWCLRPEIVYGLVVLYLASERPVLRLRSILGLSDKSDQTAQNWLSRFVALHNLLLCVFSAVVAYSSWHSVVVHYANFGFLDTYCDTTGRLWTRGNLGYWSTLFYLSKYYEWIDTWILVLKKGSGGASFLQSYHHAGIVLAMYGAVASQSAWLSWVVLLNSVIHTFMYAYFFLKTIRPSLHVPAARYLTQAQMGQFVIGIVGTWGVLIMGSSCDSQSGRFALTFLQLYGFGLLALFAAFHRRKYRPTTTAPNKSKTP